MTSANARPIVIIKKKGGHGGHHGGAWKVAYADFVTAMMALFIVLWLMNSSKQVQRAIGGYFKDPTGVSKKVGSGLLGSGENFTLTKDNMTQLKEELQKSVRQMADFEHFKNQLEMTVTSEGLRIEMMESEQGTFFTSGSTEPTGSGKEVLAKLAQELGKLPNDILIEGHTDAKPFSNRSDYTNWELSTDPANAARRIFLANGVRPDQVKPVRGFADQRLRKKEDPQDASNRRISVIVQYQVKDIDEETLQQQEKAAKEKAAQHGAPEKPGEHAAAPPAAAAPAPSHEEKKPAH